MLNAKLAAGFYPCAPFRELLMNYRHLHATDLKVSQITYAFSILRFALFT